MRIAIVGLGLIGGSLAFALRKRGHHVLGIDADEATREGAFSRGAADDVSADLGRAAECELVILAVPLVTIASVAQALVPRLLEGTMVTDVASVKAPIVEKIRQLVPPGVQFVGGHPMFGTEHRGIAAASPDLVSGATFILTPKGDEDERVVECLRGLFLSLGMRVTTMAPSEHDELLAMISHAPLLIGAALCLEANDASCAGGSFRDATRVAMSPPQMLTGIVEQNRAALKRALARLSARLSSLVDMDGASLEQALLEAQARRVRLGSPIKTCDPSERRTT